MTDVFSTVPLSQPLGRGTVGQSTKTWDSKWDSAGTQAKTTPLKALAFNALARLGKRDSKWDSIGTKAIPSVSDAQNFSPAVGQYFRALSATETDGDWEERAAIIEHDGGAPRQLAEVFAQFEICAPPPGIDPGRWHGAQEAFAGLLASGVAAKALRLGWDSREIIGICRSLSHDSPSRAGLTWSIKPGDTVPDVRRSGCIIAYGNVRHIWKRAPIGADICLPWDMAKPARIGV